MSALTPDRPAHAATRGAQRRPAHASLHPGPSRDTPWHGLPRRVGNQAMLQARLTIGAVDDPLEREADAAADQVMRTPDARPALHAGEPRIDRKCSACEREDVEQPVLRAKPDAAALAEGDVPEVVHDVLRTPGVPLPAAERSYFEPRFGVDFSAVRIHAGPQADEAARAVEARAFAVRGDLVFAAGAYAPGTHAGRHLIAHELAHAVQQGATASLTPAATPSADGAPATLRRQAAPALVEAPVEPAFEVPFGEPANDNAEALPLDSPARGPRYAPSPNDTSFEAALGRVQIANYAERQKWEAERPLATLERGGRSPDFITVEGTRQVSWLGGPGGGGAVEARVRRYHVLDALEAEVAAVTTEEQLDRLVERHFPLSFELGELTTNRGAPGFRRRFEFAPILRPIFDEPVFLPDFDPSSMAQLAAFDAALEKRVQAVPALANSRWRTNSRRRGRCQLVPTEPLGQDPLSGLYCHAVTGSPYSYRITIAAENGGGLTRRWAEIDALRGNTWFECKCGYEGLIAKANRGEGVARQVLDKMDGQVLNHSDIARTCGLEYRFIVSNERVAAILRDRWFRNVVVDVRPWEPCD